MYIPSLAHRVSGEGGGQRMVLSMGLVMVVAVMIAIVTYYAEG